MRISITQGLGWTYRGFTFCSEEYMSEDQKNQTSQTLNAIATDIFSPFKGQCLKKHNQTHKKSPKK